MSSAVDDATFRSVYTHRGRPLDLQAAAFEQGPPCADSGGFDLLPKAGEISPRTAVVVPDETIALEVFRQCYARGLRIPQDVAIAAVDGPRAVPAPRPADRGRRRQADGPGRGLRRA